MRVPWIYFASVLFLGVAVTPVWAATTTDKEYQAAKGGGLQKALDAHTLKADKNIEGKTCEADKAFGQKGCTAKFEFAIAKQGKHEDAADQPKKETVRGVYIRINTTYDKTLCDATCQNVKILQVFRHYRKNEKGEKETISPSTDEEKQRAGWAKANSPSRGWGVDSADKGPFYGPGGITGSEEDGSTDTPSTERDAPGLRADTAEDEGLEFLSCAVCVNAGVKSKIIACVNWGFYVGEKPLYSVAFDPAPPVGSGAAPQQVKDALDRFEQIPGNMSANIQF
jgi:hypothetical protein